MALANFRHQRHDPEQEFCLFAGGLVRRAVLSHDLRSTTHAAADRMQYQKILEGGEHYTESDLAILDCSQETFSTEDEEELRKLPSDLTAAELQNEQSSDDSFDG